MEKRIDGRNQWKKRMGSHLPKINYRGIPPQKSRLEYKTMEIDTAMRVEEISVTGNINVDNIANQIIIQSTTISLPSNEEPENRLDFINSQKNNRYFFSNSPPYLHVESLDGNIGNFYPINLDKALAEIFPAITNIKRKIKNLIIINFKFSFDANQFVQSNILPNNWIAYILNYKIFRSGIVRGVDLALSLKEIHKGIKFMDRSIEIKSILRLKFRDKNNNNELKDSSTIKIEFLSNLLPKFISIWSVRSRVRPFINRVQKCYNYLR